MTQRVNKMTGIVAARGVVLPSVLEKGAYMGSYLNKSTGANAIRRIVTTSGKTQRGISAEMKRSPTFLSSYMTRCQCPSLDIAAEIAAVCGWKLQFIREDGETIEVQA